MFMLGVGITLLVEGLLEQANERRERNHGTKVRVWLIK